MTGHPGHAKTMPRGRTLEYQVYRICERFSQPISWYYGELARDDQINLLAYNSVREREEFEALDYGQRTNV